MEKKQITIRIYYVRTISTFNRKKKEKKKNYIQYLQTSDKNFSQCHLCLQISKVKDEIIYKVFHCEKYPIQSYNI